MEKPDKVILVEREIPQVKAVVQAEPTWNYVRIRQFSPTNQEFVPWLEHIWAVDWDMPNGMRHMQRTVPFPAFNLVADHRRGNALHGSSRRFFEYPLSGAGHVVGFRFKPALQSVFLEKSTAELTDGSVRAEAVFPEHVTRPMNRLAQGGVSRGLIADVLSNLMSIASPVTAKAERMHRIVRHIETHESVCRVADLADTFNVTERTLQRQFKSYVGLPPKAVIERFRIHSAMENAATCEELDTTQLALKLGYFDQAHLTNAFVRVVGCTPAEYTLRNRANHGTERVQ